MSMQNLTALNHDIDIAQNFLRRLRQHQLFLDSQSYKTPDEVFVLASLKPAPLPQVSEFLNQRFLEERKADLDSLPGVIERAVLALCVTQAQMALAWNENKTPGLPECIRSDEAHVHTLFFAAVIRKGSLVDQGKLNEEFKRSTEEDLQRLMYDIANPINTSASLKGKTDEQLLDYIFILRQQFVKSYLSHVDTQCAKIHAQHVLIDSWIEQVQAETTPDNASIWTDIEEERRDSHRALRLCENAMRKIESYMESFYTMGATSNVDRNFDVVRYAPAPLNSLDPNTP